MGEFKQPLPGTTNKNTAKPKSTNTIKPKSYPFTTHETKQHRWYLYTK